MDSIIIKLKEVLADWKPKAVMVDGESFLVELPPRFDVYYDFENCTIYDYFERSRFEPPYGWDGPQPLTDEEQKDIETLKVLCLAGFNETICLDFRCEAESICLPSEVTTFYRRTLEPNGEMVCDGIRIPIKAVRRFKTTDGDKDNIFTWYIDSGENRSHLIDKSLVRWKISSNCSRVTNIVSGKVEHVTSHSARAYLMYLKKNCVGEDKKEHSSDIKAKALEMANNSTKLALVSLPDIKEVFRTGTPKRPYDFYKKLVKNDGRSGFWWLDFYSE